MLIVMAADYVGNQVIEYLCDRKMTIAVLVVDHNNRGGFNDKMIAKILSTNPSAEIYNNLQLENPMIKSYIKSKKLNLGILAWWPYIINEEIIALAQRGFVNTHPGYLPYNRGKHPYFWCMIDNTPFGATLHFVDKDIDCGRIIAQERIEYNWEDTGESLYLKSRECILSLFYENFDRIINDTITNTAVVKEDGTFHAGKELNPYCNIQLDKMYTARDLLNIFRGRMFNGKGEAGFLDNGIKYTVSIHIEREIAEEE